MRWYARYRTPDGEQRSETFDRKVDAERFLVEVESSKLRGSFVDPRRSGVLVGAWATDWLAAQADLPPSTRARYEGILTTHIVPRWERVRLADVTHAEVQRWLTGLDLAPAIGAEGAPGAVDGAGVRGEGRPAGGQPGDRGQPAAGPAGRARGT